MGQSLDPLAAVRLVISQYQVTDDGIVQFGGRRASAEEIVAFKRAIAALELMLQQMLNLEP